MTRQARRLKLPRTYSVAFSSNGEALVAVAKDVFVWNARARTRRFRSHPLTNPIHACFSPSGHLLAVKSTSGAIAVLDGASGGNCSVIDSGRNVEGCNLLFSPCGRYLIDGSWRGHLTVRTAETGALAFAQEFPGGIGHVAYNATTGLWYVLHSSEATDPNLPPPDAYITVWSWPFDRARKKIALQTPFVVALAPSPDGACIALASGAGAQALSVIDTHDGRLIEQIPVARIQAVSWAPSGSELASVEDHEVVFRAFPGLTPRASIKLPYACAVEYSPDETLIALAAWEGGLLVPRAEIT